MTNDNSWGDGFQSLFFDAARVKLGVHDRASDVERTTDDRNIPDSVDLKYNQKPTDSAGSLGLQNNKMLLGVAASLTLLGAFILSRKGKR